MWRFELCGPFSSFLPLCTHFDPKQQINVVGLLYDENKRLVEGVKFLDLSGSDLSSETYESKTGTQVQTLRADFVVASPGRTNPIPRWFTNIGIFASEKEVESEFILPNVRYCSSLMRPPAGMATAFVALVVVVLCS